MKVSDFSEDGLSSLPGPSSSHFWKRQSSFLRIPSGFLKVIVFLHWMTQCWGRSCCQFCKVTFSAFSFAARLEKTFLNTFPGLFPLFYKSYQSNLVIRTFQKFILLQLLHALVMCVTSNAVWSYPLHMDNTLNIWIKLSCVYGWTHLYTFKDRLRGTFYSKARRCLFVNKQVVLVGKVYFCLIKPGMTDLNHCYDPWFYLSFILGLHGRSRNNVKPRMLWYDSIPGVTGNFNKCFKSSEAGACSRERGVRRGEVGRVW